MGVSLPKPPRGASPEAFFTEYVPSLALAFCAGFPTLAQPVETGLELVGGPSFTLRFWGTRLEVSEGLPSTAVRVRLTVEDWREQVAHVLPPVLRYTEKNMARAQTNATRFLGKSLDLSRLAAEPGQIDVTLTDDAGDSTLTSVILGTGKGPRVTIALSLDDVWSLLDAGGRVTKLLSSRARVEGDLQYVLKLAASLGLG